MMLAVAGCGSGEPTARPSTSMKDLSPMPTVPVSKPDQPPTPAEALEQWRLKTSQPIAHMSSAMVAIGEAAQKGDLASLKAACPALRTSSDELQATLPSPDQRVTAKLQGAADDFRSMVDMCLTANAAWTSTEVEKFEAYFKGGQTKLNEALELLGVR